MRVLFIRSNPVNPDSRVEKEVETLIYYGHNVSILCWDRDNNYEIIKSKKKLFRKNCDIFRAGIKSGYGDGFRKNIIPLLKFQNVIRKFLKKNSTNFDVIHACDFDTGFTSYFNRGKCKFVYDVFDYYVDSFSVPDILNKFICRCEDYICNHADELILCTEERKKQIHNLKQERISIIHNTPMELISSDYDIHFSGKIKIVYIGILGENRMIMELINVVKRHSDLELHIAGFGGLQERISYESKNNDRIIFYGKIPYDKTLFIEKNCDIMTAIYDPDVKNHKYAAPNKFYEALCLGKPVIMIKGTGMSDIVQDNDIGLVIDYDEAALEQAIISIKENKKNWQSKNMYIKKMYSYEYSWRIMSKRLYNLYDRLI